MSLPRPSRRLAALVAAWFLLWLGAAVAAPLAGDAELQLVCSGTSVKLVQPGRDDAPTAMSAHLGQCPACVQVVAPPPAPAVLPAAPVRTAAPARAHVGPVQGRDAASPPAARGPPSLS